MEASQVHQLADRMTEWWSSKLIASDKRTAFEDALRPMIAAQIDEAEEDARGWFTLYVDYDPEGTLLAALRESGIACRGFMFSADDVFRGCQKSGLRYEHGGTVKQKLGYGGAWIDLE